MYKCLNYVRLLNNNVVVYIYIELWLQIIECNFLLTGMKNSSFCIGGLVNFDYSG